MRILVAAAAVLVGAGATAGQDFDKSRHPWGMCKVGAFVKYTLSIDSGGISQEGDLKIELTGLKEKEYSTHIVMGVAGNNNEETETETFGERKGEETLKIGDNGHKCVIWASGGKRGEKEISTKTWMAEGKDVPVRMANKVGDQEEGEYTAVALSERISAAGREYDCVRLEGTLTNELGKMNAKLWMNSAIPGGVVRMELEGAGDAKFKINLELAEFDAKKSLAAAWTAKEGMEGPESAYVDPESGALFVSQVAGSPVEKDGRGWISRLTVEGKVVAARWVEGLNAPKGLRSHKGILWAADIDTVVGIEIASGKVVQKIPVEGAKFLNDLACGADGTVYVSDMLQSRIHAVKDGKVALFAEGEDLEYPNGLLVDGKRLVVGGWGKPSEDFSTKVPGRLFALDLESKKKTLITPEPVGNLDGIEADGRGGFIVTDWIAGKVLQVAADGKAKTLATFAKGAADHAYIAAKKLLILPHMLENQVCAYDLSKLAD